jgi:hypothetical protein
MADTDRRIMRIPLPIALIRDMDAVILEGLGGYSTRAEFIIDAIQERILELTIDTEEDAGPPAPLRVPDAPLLASAPPVTTQQIRTSPLRAATPGPSTSPTTAEATRIPSVSTGYVLGPDAVVSQTRDTELFGLHNRDFPSLWALHKLASAAQDAPVEIEDFYRQLLADAWEFGTVLSRLTDGMGKKHSALFPTNTDKPKSAEEAFRTFAVGDYRVTKVGEVLTSGPLFAWKAAGITAQAGRLQIAVTAPGWDLLRSCAGIDVAQPHSESAANTFLEHLMKHAPADWAGFAGVLKSIGPEGAAHRSELLERLQEMGFSWKDSELSTNASGYVARCREWGLLELKQVKGRYLLTDYGRSFADGLEPGEEG